LLGKRVATDAGGVDGLAVGFVVAAVGLSPFAPGTKPVWTSPEMLTAVLGVGVLSTVVPYVFDQVVLRRVGQARFALLLALLPVSAAVMGFLVLDQVPAIPEACGILAVAGGLTLRSREPTEPPV
jgi:inner membrane transporter RhtA